jgi:ankyrin repeat protein/L-ascorbate metabolism protein UlaG (beta-lactamase superfamily)
MIKRILLIVALAAPMMAAYACASEIHDAVRAGNVEQVRALLAANSDLINDRDTAQSLPLHLAAYYGNTDIIELLLAKGADINIGDRENTSPLTIAAMLNRMEAVRLLTERGAEITARDINGEIPLICATRRANLEMVRFLIEHGAPIGDTSALGSNCLLIAASVGADSLVDYFLEHNLDPNAINANGHDALYLAVTTGHNSTALKLIENGADIQYRNEQGETRLHMAAWAADTAVAAALVARGLAIDERDNYGVTPLTNTGYGNFPMAQWLVDHGADVNACTDSTGSPLLRAVWGGNVDIVRLFTERGADVNRHGRNAGPPLQAAVTRGEREMAGILLDAGADVDFIERNYGRTMLHLAAINGDSVMAQLLLDHGAEVGPEDESGRTPLYYAVRYANPTVASLLKAQGATLPDEAARRPPDLLSAKTGYGEAIVWYLKNSGWAVKTANHFLIFDYFVPPSNPDRPCLANGRIDPQEIKGFDVTVFSSHEHGDHYDTSIFGWRDVIPKITYVLGHRPTGMPEYQYTAPRTDQMIDGMRVRTIRATDAGVGFLVEVDGVVIFHAGDHANGVVGLDTAYTDEIDYLASLNLPVDMAFLPVIGCGLGTPESVREGAVYALQKLSPEVFFPQHAMNNEQVFREISDYMKEEGLTVKSGCAENSGDCFRYRDHSVF